MSKEKALDTLNRVKDQINERLEIMNEGDDLLPCPWCGEFAMKYTILGEDQIGVMCAAQDLDCDCHVSPNTKLMVRDEAVEAWNNRPFEKLLIETIIKAIEQLEAS